MVVNVFGVVDMASRMVNILERSASVFFRRGNIGEFDGW
jgi:hypothetical protein